MNGNNGYAVFFFPQAIEALGEAIKPYLQDGPGGPHVVCGAVDTGGAFIEMNLAGATEDGQQVDLELMVPTGMVRMIVSAHSDEMFGFGPHAFRNNALKQAAATPGQAPVESEVVDAAPAAAAQQAVAPAPVVTNEPASAPADAVATGKQ